MAALKKSEFRPSKTRVKMTSGDMLRTLRELQEMSQLDLARAASLPQSAISAIENDRSPLGVERAERLARALQVHPAVLVWPDWSIHGERKRAAG
jgi:transcriptional regulator with XRE-family HTH domain